jgi:hypothetical protein
MGSEEQRQLNQLHHFYGKNSCRPKTIYCTIRPKRKIILFVMEQNFHFFIDLIESDLCKSFRGEQIISIEPSKK